MEQRQLLTDVSATTIAVEHGEGVRREWVDHQLTWFQRAVNATNPQESFVDFYIFKKWAQQSLNVYAFLEVFEIVPSPAKEHEIIFEILESYSRQHGDVMYAMSYRWWDSWKEYTEKHSSTQEKDAFVAQLKENIVLDPLIDPKLKHHLLNWCGEEQVSHEDDFDKVFAKSAWTDFQSGTRITRKNDILNASLSLQQQILVGKRAPTIDAKAQDDVDLSIRAQAAKLENSQQEEDLNEKGDGTPRIVTDLSISRTKYLEYKILQNRTNKSAHFLSHTHRTKSSKAEILQINSVAQNFPFQSIRQSQVEKLKKFQNTQILEQNFDEILVEEIEDEHFSNIENSHYRPSKKRMFQSGIIPSKGDSPLGSSSVKLEEGMPDGKSESLMQTDRVVKTQMNLLNCTGERPPAIDNQDIQGEHPQELLPNLIMYRDLVLLPEKAWQTLQSWYGGGPALPRKVIIHNSVPSIELYPPRITCVLADQTGNPIADSQRSLFVSSEMTLNEVHLKVCESFNYISTKDTRLWFKENCSTLNEAKQNAWQLQSGLSMGKTLEDFIVKQGDLFMVEVKFYGNQWPLDQKPAVEREWRQFEIGDKVDFCLSNEWCIGRVVKVFRDSIKVHLVHHALDETVKKNSNQLEQFGKHTLALHFKKATSTEAKYSDYSLVSRKVFGLVNIGNTCYMNSALQSLLHTPLFAKYFNSQNFAALVKKDALKNKDEEPTTISAAFAQMVHQQQLEKQSAIQPTVFKKVVNAQLPLFYGNQQQDAAEFINFMLDKMNDELNRVLQVEKIEHQRSLSEKSDQAKKTRPNQDGGTGGQNEVKEIEPLSSKLLTEEKQGDEASEEKIKQENLTKRAILETKETIYNQFFAKSNPNLNMTNQDEKAFSPRAMTSGMLAKVSPLRRVSVVSQPSSESLRKQQPSALSLDPNLTELEHKAKQAWFRDMNSQNSPISDLFMGQQATTVQCQRCKTKTYSFQNFYSLPIPLPVNSKATLYCHVIRRTTQEHIPTQAFRSYGILIEKNANLAQLKLELEKASQIQLSSRFVIAEIVNNKIYRLYDEPTTLVDLICKRTNDLYFYEQLNDTQRELIREEGSGILHKSSKRQFFNFNTLTPGLIIDAKNSYNNWMVAYVVEKKFDFVLNRAQIKIHFFELTDRWDEWLTESFENLGRLAPYSTYAEEPSEKFFGLPLTHRDVRSVEGEGKENLQPVAFGLPHFFTTGSWMTWQQFAKEVSLQMLRYTRPEQSSTATINSEDTPSEESRSQRKIQFSAKKSKDKQPVAMDLFTTTSPRMESSSPKISFKIKLLDGETHKCAFCIYKQKVFATKSEQELAEMPQIPTSNFQMWSAIVVPCKFGCELPDSHEKMYWFISLFKKLDIVIDWDRQPSSLATLKFLEDPTFVQLKKTEQAKESGIPLDSCLKLLGKKEQIPDFQCDSCLLRTDCIASTQVSHLPDILLLHLKRFQFEGGYLGKIEDLVTFPKSLDMSKHVIGSKPKVNYDLYSVIYHHMFQNHGGHYTSAINVDNHWLLANDSLVEKLPSDSVVSKDAYVLCYKRREFTPSNIVNFSH